MSTPAIPLIREWTVTRRRIEEFPVDGMPLGRHVHHDSRSLWYPYQRQFAGSALVSVLHDRRIPILDQGAVRSCVGNGEVGCCGTDPLFDTMPAGVTLDEAEALAIYSAAETIDGDGPYPPNDNGSSGLSGAQAAKNASLISGYTHILSLADLLDALQTGPVSIGINWYDSFDAPGSTGELVISANASVRGGHEPMLRGVDVTKQQVFGDNSWGTSWGPLGGSFVIGYGTVTRLLAEQGDGTVSVPLTSPAPVPTPPGPTPVPPGPGPAPTPGPGPEDVTLYNATRGWSHGDHVGPNAHAAKAVRTWAKDLGFPGHGGGGA
jgi:hypothetical protein